MTLCPGCSARTHLIGKYYKCHICGAEERDNPTGNGSMWVRNGTVIAAPEAVEDQLIKAEELNPTGDWDKARKKLYKPN